MNKTEHAPRSQTGLRLIAVGAVMAGCLSAGVGLSAIERGIADGTSPFVASPPPAPPPVETPAPPPPAPPAVAEEEVAMAPSRSPEFREEAAAPAPGPEPMPGSPGGGPDLSAAPNYGTFDLRTGFTPDPTVIRLTAGGNVDAATIGQGCIGAIAQAPDVRFSYSAHASLPLIISVESGADTTLVINAPDGRWYCDDDSGEGNHPSVRFEQPLSGDYDVWVGLYGRSETPQARLYISELYSQ